MQDNKCSFALTIIKNDFACEKSQMVTRRAGPDIACVSKCASTQCEKLYSELKKVGLTAFDAEDAIVSYHVKTFAESLVLS